MRLRAGRFGESEVITMERTMSVPERRGSFDWTGLTKEQIDAEIQIGVDSIKAGRVISSEQPRSGSHPSPDWCRYYDSFPKSQQKSGLVCCGVMNTDS